MGEYEKLKKENSQLKEEIDLLTKELERYRGAEPNADTILLAIEHSLGGIAIADGKWNLKYVNPAVLKMWGYSSPAEMIGRNFSDFFFIKSLENLEEAKETLAKSGSWQGELTGKKKDGESFAVLTSQSAVKDKDGKVTNIVTSYIDITQYKNALRDIAKSEIKYRATLDNMEDIIYVVNRDLHITLINNALIDWHEKIGLKAGKFVGQNIFDILPFLEEKVKNEYNLVFENKQILITEDEYLLKGKRFVMETRKIPVSEGGETDRIVTIMRDITVKKVVEEELQRSEEKYRLIADNVPVGIFIHVDGNIIFCGREGAHLLGYDEPEEIVGRNVTEFIHEENRVSTINKAKRRAKGEDVPTGYEIKMVKKDGEIITVLVYGSVLKYLGETAIQGVFIDISKRKKIEEERERLLVRLKDSEERYRTLIETSNDMVCVIKDRKVIFFNKKLPSILGFSEDEIRNNIFDNYIHPDDIEMILDKRVRRMRGEDVPTTYEFRLLAKNGEIYPVEINVAIIDWEGGDAVLCFLRDIKKRKEAEEAIRESEERWRNLFENSLDAVFTTDTQGNMTSVNEAMEATTGYSTDYMIGKSYGEIMSPEEGQRVFEAYNRLYRTGEPIKEFIYNITRKDGHKRIVEGNANVIKKGDKIIGFQGTFRDITEKRETERALKESEKKYRDLVENIDDMIYIMDGEGNLKFLNNALYKFLGYNQEEIVQKGIKDIVTPESFEYAKKVFKRQLAGEDVEVFELQFMNKNGELKTSEMRERLIWEENRIIEIHGIGRDITERKKAEEAIRESEEKYRNLIESSKDVIFLSSVGGNLIDINPAGEELFGYDLDELIGMNIQNLYYNKEDREKFQRAIEEKGFVKDYNILFRKKDDKPIDCLMTSTLRREEDGTITGYQGIIRDITDRKLLEQQLLQAQKMKAVGTLAGGMAHNFNNILVGIMGYSEYLLNRKEKNDPDYKALKTIYDSTIQASDLTRQLLNIARGGDYKRVKINLNSVVKKVIPLIKGTIDKTIEVVTDLESGLKAMEGDVGQLEQCLLNLCINSRDAMPNGGKIIIETKNQVVDKHFVKTHVDAKIGSYVVLSVTDTGTGIAPDIIDNIFEPFFTTKKRAGGSGMGLATVYGIVKNLHGIIMVYSEVGEGSTFKLYFPTIEEKIVEDILMYEDIAPGGNETILLVDDEKVVRDMWREVLKELGYKVIISEGGEKAIEIVRKRGKKIDLVILDIVMPDLSGREVFDGIMEIEPTMKVLVSSGYSENGQASDILDAGAHGFIQKPSPMLKLTNKIREVLDAEDEQ